MRRGHELGITNPRWQNPSGEWVEECEQLVELDAKLPSVMSGEESVRDAEERIGYVKLSYKKRLFATAAGFYEQHWPKDPTWLKTCRTLTATTPPAARPWPARARETVKNH